jgi:hypothetical protein
VRLDRAAKRHGFRLHLPRIVLRNEARLTLALGNVLLAQASDTSRSRVALLGLIVAHLDKAWVHSHLFPLLPSILDGVCKAVRQSGRSVATQNLVGGLLRVQAIVVVVVPVGQLSLIV